MKKTKNAFEKIGELLALRDHSEKELRTKLLAKNFSSQEIEGAIEQAHHHHLILEPQKLSQNVYEQLNRKQKGIFYINQYLKSKGLPVVEPDWELEHQKAMEIIGLRFSQTPPYSTKEKQDIYRYLTNRGYATETINRVLHEKR